MDFFRLKLDLCKEMKMNKSESDERNRVNEVTIYTVSSKNLIYLQKNHLIYHVLIYFLLTDHRTTRVIRIRISVVGMNAFPLSTWGSVLK